MDFVQNMDSKSYDQLCKYAGMKVLQVGKYCKYASMQLLQVCKYESIANILVIRHKI